MTAPVVPQPVLAAGSHLDDCILEEYCMGMLSPEMRDAVEDHVICCSHCAQRMQQEDDWTSCFKAVFGSAIPASPKFLHATA